jgi:hypothetical protein
MSLAYACSCLNVRLHVASTTDRSNTATDELGPELTGWKLPLGVGGISIVRFDRRAVIHCSFNRLKNSLAYRSKSL